MRALEADLRLLEFFASGSAVAGLACTCRTVFGAESAVLDGDTHPFDGPLARCCGTAGNGLVAHAAGRSLRNGAKQGTFAQFGCIDLRSICFDGFAGLVELFGAVGQTGKRRHTILAEGCARSIARALGHIGVAREEAIEIGGAKRDAAHGAAVVFVDATVADVDFDT